MGGVLHKGLFFVLLLGSGRGRLDIAGWLEGDVIAEDLEVGGRVAAGGIGGVVVVCHDAVCRAARWVVDLITSIPGR